MEIIDMSLMA